MRKLHNTKSGKKTKFNKNDEIPQRIVFIVLNRKEENDLKKYIRLGYT